MLRPNLELGAFLECLWCSDTNLTRAVRCIYMIEVHSTQIPFELPESVSCQFFFFLTTRDMVKLTSFLSLGIFLGLGGAQSLTANQLWGGINTLTQGTDRLKGTASGISGLTALLTTPVR